ncbi:unnamed protein product [Dibothriocephalus latus]|uniref:Uncharacterized protein n=1 Tax=Dibothriocephalus latus TaxID=60516 RepID=A0A3P7NUV3_DIBLA|nr:unnamed protein product [Dibothriocephalus latus]
MEKRKSLAATLQTTLAKNNELETEKAAFAARIKSLEEENNRLMSYVVRQSKVAEEALAEEKSHGESQEAELKSLRSLNAEKQQCLEEHRLQNESLVLLNREFRNRVNVRLRFFLADNFCVTYMHELILPSKVLWE